MIRRSPRTTVGRRAAVLSAVLVALAAAVVVVVLVRPGAGRGDATSDDAAARPGSARAAATPQAFPAGAPVDYQIGGPFTPDAAVRIVDRDRTARPVAGRYNICYVNAFQAQPDASAWWKAHHRDLLLRNRAGHYVVDTDWHELILDISTRAKRVALMRIVGPWIDGCARSGFQAVEPDNLDSYQRSQHLISADDAVHFATDLARRAHARGLSIGQKNTAELTRRIHAAGYRFAVAEQCQQYGECTTYSHVYGRAVIEIEYEAQYFRAACAARRGTVSITLRDLDVLPRGQSGFVDERC